MSTPDKTERPPRKSRPDNVLGDKDRKLGAVLRLTQPPPRKRNLFRSLAHHASNAVGRPWAFAAALAVVVAWAGLGPLFHYSDTWQLVINTSTTIITFLMVFLIQSAQNRDTEALRLKLDALILAIHSVSNVFVGIEDFDDEELENVRAKIRSMATRESGESDT